MAELFGDSGDNLIIGTKRADTIDASQGGKDTIQAGLNDDQIYLGQALTAADQIDGGAGSDTVYLDGDYHLRFRSHTLRDVEALGLAGGHDYDLTFADGNVASRGTLVVSADTLSASDTFIFNGSGETNGRFVLVLGEARTAVRGGDGNDAFAVYGAMHPDDSFDGGKGLDSLQINAVSAAAYQFDGSHLHRVELIDVGGDQACEMTIADDVLAGRQSIFINAALAGGLNLDASAEATASYDVDGSENGDTLLGGGGYDKLDGAGGGDLIKGGGGDDEIIGGDGADTVFGAVGADTIDLGDGDPSGSGASGDTVIYNSVKESTAIRADRIEDLTNAGNTVDLSAIDANIGLAGNQAFTKVNAFTQHAGELTLVYHADTDTTLLSGDVDGDGQADLMIVLLGSHADFTGLIF